jgi:hypothetical protein
VVGNHHPDRRPKTMTALGSRQPDSTTRRRSVDQRSFAVLVAPGCARSSTGGRPGSVLAPHGQRRPALGQDLPAGLPVVAGIQVTNGWASSKPTTPLASRVAASSPSLRWVSWGGQRGQRDTAASAAAERFSP